MRSIPSTLLIALALLSVPLAAASAAPTLVDGTHGEPAGEDDDVVTRQLYAGGLSTIQGMPVTHTTNACLGPANAGGLCNETVPTETNLAIIVSDAALGRVPFHWQGLDATGQPADCPHGHSIGEDTLVLEPACPNLDVHVGLTATAGQITIKKADVVII